MDEIKQLKSRKNPWRFLGFTIITIALLLFIDSQENGYALMVILILLNDIFNIEITEGNALVAYYCLIDLVIDK